VETLDKGAVEAVAELARGIVTGETNGVPYVVAPNGFSVSWLDKYLSNRDNPIRKEGSVLFADAASLIEYHRLYSDANSRLFADLKSATITEVFDYHESAGNARWGKHRATFTVAQTTEWLTWCANNGKRKSQQEFAEFIEDNSADILRPSAADMNLVARDLEAKKDVQFASAIRLDNGQTQFTYSEETKASVGKGKIEVPENFTLRLRVFQGADPVEVIARLRYRIAEGKLVMWYDLLRPQKLMEEAFEAVVSEVSEKTNTHVFLGKVG
jgi:uncharacterized protein YfdQ (DUF2303 family)